MEGLGSLVGNRSIPTHRLDPIVQRWLIAAQAEADRRGARYLLSGLVLLAAASAGDEFSRKLREALNVDHMSMVEDAFDMEWSDRPVSFLDQPPTIIRESIEKAAAGASESGGASPQSFISILLSFDDGMAARIAKRLGANPMEVSRRLSDLTE